MSNVSSAIGCFPTADQAFGPAIDSSCRGDFDFTITFEQCIFTILPSVILLLAAPFQIRHLSNAHPKFKFTASSSNTFKYVKLGAIAIFAVFQLTQMAWWAAQSEHLGRLRAVSIAASCVSFVASLMFCALSYVEHAKSLRPSSILNAYLLVSVVLDGAIMRTFWLTDNLSTAICATFSVSFALKVIMLVLEAKEKAVYTSEEGMRNPEATSGLYSRGLCWWLNPLLLDGFRRLLKPHDLYTLDEDMSAGALNEKFWAVWNRASTRGGKYGLVLVCVNTLKWHLLGVVVPRLLLLAFTICQPLVLSRFLDFLGDSSQSANVGHGLVGAYGLVYLGIALSSSFYYQKSYRTVTMLRGILISAVFSRSTDLSITDIDNSAAVTLMSTDVDAIIRASREVHELWANVIQVGLATWLLSTQIGFACVGPVVVSLLSLLATAIVAPRAQGYTVTWIQKVQKRIGITSTMLGHIKSIRMSGLSTKPATTISDLRREEIDAAFPFRMLGAATSAIAQIPVLLSPVAAFAFYTIHSLSSGESLDATRMFSSLSLVILLGQPLFWLFEVVLDMNSALGCFQRIQKFLTKTEKLDPREIGRESGASNSNTQLSRHGLDVELRDMRGSLRARSADVDLPDVQVRDASFSWSTEGRAVLDSIEMTVKPGDLAILVGPVAAGKSTLLKGLLGEVPETTGFVNLKRSRLSWCEQDPWLINDTIRKNITGYAPFEPEMYRMVS